MSPTEFAQQVGGFSSLSTTGKIEHLFFYLNNVRGIEKVKPIDLATCFDELHLKKPQSFSPFLKSLADRKPARIIKDSQGYRLSMKAREDFVKNIPINNSNTITSKLLGSLTERLSNSTQQQFFKEAVACYSAKAFRATVIMTWNLTYAHVCDEIFTNHLSPFNAQLASAFPKNSPTQITKREDFEDIKESRVLEVARGSRIIPNSMYKILSEKLNKRNMAAHPSSALFTSISAEEVVHDLIENVLLKFR